MLRLIPKVRFNLQMDTLFSGSIVVFLGLLLRILLLLVFEMVAARHLGPASYGTFALAFTIVLIVSQISITSS